MNTIAKNFNIIEKEVEVENNTYVSYGIERGEIRYDDLSINRKKVEKFIDMLNRNNVSDIHISDLIDDFIG